MIKQGFRKICDFFFIITIVLATSCNRNDVIQTPASVAVAAIPGSSTAISSESKSLSGALDTLWTDASTFLSINRQIAFRFYIGDADTVTLHGWSLNGNVFKEVPDIKLMKGRVSDITYGAGSYFGNLLLKISEIVTVKRLIKSSASKYVLFAPQDPKQNNGQITYAILLTNDDPSASIKVLGPTTSISSGIRTNPSPPRNATQ